MTEPITGSNSLLESELNALAERLKSSGQPEITREHVKELLAEKMSASGSTPTQAVGDDDDSSVNVSTPPPQAAKLQAHSQLKVAKSNDYLDTMPEDVGRIVNDLIVGLPELGLAKTIDKAKTDSPLILDALHDSLTTRLYEELKNRKLI